MVLTRSSFQDLTVIELIQNISCYIDYKREKNCWYHFDIFHEYIRWKFEFLCFKLSECFWDIIYIFENLEQDDEFLHPGSTTNERNFYNRLLHYEKKIIKTL